MGCRESRGVNGSLYFGLFLFSASLCHCATLTRLKALDELGGNSTVSQSRGKEGRQDHGALLFVQKLLRGPKSKSTKTTNNTRDIETDYQADVAWGEAKQPDGQYGGLDLEAMERLLKMEPKVECTLDSMTLQVHDAASTPGSLLFVDRGSHLSPLPLSKLPSSCGYTISSTQRDLVLVAPYDGCFVTLQEDNYVLPLLWWGIPVRMSCPFMSSLSLNPPMVTCNTAGMLVKMEWTLPVSNIKVKLNDNWEPLTVASNRCGFSTVEHPEGVVISAHYAPCLEKKDGLYTLEVAGDGEATISCPSQLPAQSEFTENLEKDPEWQNETPSIGVYTPAFPHDPDQAVLPQNSNMLNQRPEDTDRPFHPTFFYSASPVNTPAAPTVNPRHASSPVVQTDAGRRWQHFSPFYSQPPAPSLITKPPAGYFDKHLLPSPINPQPSLLQEPYASQPESQDKKPPYSFSFYSQPSASEGHPPYHKLPEQPEEAEPETQNQLSHLYHFYPQPKPDVQPATNPSTVPQPPQPEAPQRQVHQQMFFCPENQLARNPNAALASAAERLLGQVHKLCQPSETPAGTNDENPVQSTPPLLRHPQGQMHHLLNQFYYPQQLQLLQPVTLPSATYMQQQVAAKPSDQTYPESAISLTINSDTAPQDPQLSSEYMEPVYFPVCSSGLSNCCPQITFYQHLHITPARVGSNDVPHLFPDLSFPPTTAYFEFGVGSARLSQKSTEAAAAATTQSASSYTSVPLSLHPFPAQNVEQLYLQPPDGNPTTPRGNHPSWTANHEPLNLLNPTSTSLDAHWPYLHSQPSDHYNDPYKPLPSGYDPAGRYQLNNIKSPVQVNSQLLTGNLNRPTLPNFMSNNQNSQQQHNKSPGEEFDHFMVPFDRLQHAPVSTYNNAVVPNNSKPFISDSNSKREQTLNFYSGNYVLLQREPPGREPNSFMDSSELYRDPTVDLNFRTQSLAKEQNGKHQTPLNLKPLQGNEQLSKWLEEGIPTPSPGNANHDDGDDYDNENEDDDDVNNSGLPFLSPTTDGPPLIFPLYKPPLGAAQLKLKSHESFKDFSTPLGSNNRFPPHNARKTFQGRG
ncbi:uncharacterized protein LOC102080467 isoform X1 [Oreochromis niloticus]|uniref:Uncharacterized LOC102080467 n=2 Tax=Oreochromis niloticus TaxID=8128 RepID=A0A669C9P2_ORENI|nr:uncharacterized protein LOC102080467 isoform X1 [Oreochromis niloticus]